MAIEEIVSQMVTEGIFSYILPFVLAFVVIYGILEKYSIISKQKNINVVTSLVLGLFLLYFGRLFDVGGFLGFFISKSFLMILVIMFVLMITVFLFTVLKEHGLIEDAKKGTWSLGIFTTSLVLVYAMLNSTPDSWKILFGLDTGIGSGTIEGAIVIGVILFFISWVIESQNK